MPVDHDPGCGAGAAPRPSLRERADKAAATRADSLLADAFCRSRLGGGRGMVFGTLAADAGIDVALARAWND